MCGIAGFFSHNQRFSIDELNRMTTVLQHRGPDAHGVFSDSICSLGHRRLSIIDLDSRSNQPMHSHNNRYVMAYNGEVYNYKEIIAKLNLQNLRTTSDSEVILESFVQHGIASLDYLNGMFAIAIYDKEVNQLLLVRDRIGIKPLYYYWDGSDFAFASELKSLLQLNIKKELNHQAINYFLQLGFIPAPHSIYKNIFKANSGHYLTVNKTGIKETPYWNIAEKISKQTIKDESIAVTELEKFLFSSVEWQLRSDVPVGVFLSGGIDSSIIAAISSKVHSQKVNTYSIGFDENTHDESVHAAKVAKLLNTNHHEFKVSYKDALNLLEIIPEVYDEPFGDPSAIPTIMVSKLAAAHVKVVLSGDGGDELFFGYGAYKWSNRLHKPWMKLLHQPLSLALKYLPNRYKRVSRLLHYQGETPDASHILSQEQYMFNKEEAKELLTQQHTLSALQFEKTNSFNRKLLPAELQDFFDLRYYLQDDLLVKVDRASMLSSLEVRVPLLDHRLIEFAVNLNHHLKIHNGKSKYILKQLLYQYLPEELFNRPKQGFAIPVAKWLKNELSGLMNEALSKQNIEHFGILNYAEVENLRKEFDAGHDYHYNRLWQLLILNLWLKKID